MIRVLDDKQDDLCRICREYRVQRLELFGSALRDDCFDPRVSDLDFLVEFLPLSPGEHFDTYFGLLLALEDLFDRHVDLVMTRAIRNPYFLESVNQTRTVLYAA
ncbi:MAG: nucleotidyltransferase domain-containing protein [Planctomycetes bacterium]|nr:nucleotidyltransferase domain-containing protein [Planctomycetota bacterium]